MSSKPTLGIRMFERLPVLFRSAMYALRGGFLIRPLVIAMMLGAAGATWGEQWGHPTLSLALSLAFSLAFSLALLRIHPGPAELVGNGSSGSYRWGRSHRPAGGSGRGDFSPGSIRPGYVFLKRRPSVFPDPRGHL